VVSLSGVAFINDVWAVALNGASATTYDFTVGATGTLVTLLGTPVTGEIWTIGFGAFSYDVVVGDPYDIAGTPTIVDEVAEIAAAFLQLIDDSAADAADFEARLDDDAVARILVTNDSTTFTTTATVAAVADSAGATMGISAVDTLEDIAASLAEAINADTDNFTALAVGSDLVIVNRANTAFTTTASIAGASSTSSAPTVAWPSMMRGWS